MILSSLHFFHNSERERGGGNFSIHGYMRFCYYCSCVLLCDSLVNAFIYCSVGEYFGGKVEEKQMHENI